MSRVGQTSMRAVRQMSTKMQTAAAIEAERAKNIPKDLHPNFYRLKELQKKFQVSPCGLLSLCSIQFQFHSFLSFLCCTSGAQWCSSSFERWRQGQGSVLHHYCDDCCRFGWMCRIHIPFTLDDLFCSFLKKKFSRPKSKLM